LQKNKRLEYKTQHRKHQEKFAHLLQYIFIGYKFYINFPNMSRKNPLFWLDAHRFGANHPAAVAAKTPACTATVMLVITSPVMEDTAFPIHSSETSVLMRAVAS